MAAPLPFPGPRLRWWGLSMLRAMRHDYLGQCDELHARHGDRISMRIARERVLDLYDPEDLRAVLVDHADALIRWERGPEVFAEFMGQSVLVTEGAVWQRQRRMLQPAFAPRRMDTYAGLMLDAIQLHLDRSWAPGAREARHEMGPWFSTLTMDIILRTLFSTPVGSDSAQASRDVQTFSETALRELFWPYTLPDWLPLPGKAAKRAALRRMRALVGGYIAARRQGGPTDDLLAMLQSLRDEQTGQPLSEAEVFDQCMVTFQAGHETSATALLWWSWLMARHADVQAAVTAELDNALAGRAPGPQDLAALPLLTATLKESMRLYPPIASLLSRRNTRPITVAGQTVPARTMLRLTPWVLHHDARWFPEPKAFRPERFLPGAPAIPRGAYLPFGAGPRVCLGQHFAMLEMTLVAALLLQRCSLHEVPGQADPVPQLHVTLRPAAPLPLLLRLR